MSIFQVKKKKKKKKEEEKFPFLHHLTLKSLIFNLKFIIYNLKFIVYKLKTDCSVTAEL